MNATGSVILNTNIVVDYFGQDLALHTKIDQANNVYLPLEVLGDSLRCTQVRTKRQNARPGEGTLGLVVF